MDSETVRSKNNGLCRACRAASIRSSCSRSAVACGSAASSRAYKSAIFRPPSGGLLSGGAVGGLALAEQQVVRAPLNDLTVLEAEGPGAWALPAAGRFPAVFAGLDVVPAGVAAQQIPPGLEARSASWRAYQAGRKVLLVLDDATGSDQVRPLLPGAAGCLVLVTSRRRLIALEEAAPISLGTLPPGEAADLFVRLACRPGLQSADAAIAEVAGLCGCLPLAIRLVAAGLRHHSGWTVTDLAAELATTCDRLEAMQAEDVSVAAAFDLSYQDLTTGQRLPWPN